MYFGRRIGMPDFGRGGGNVDVYKGWFCIDSKYGRHVIKSKSVLEMRMDKPG